MNKPLSSLDKTTSGILNYMTPFYVRTAYAECTRSHQTRERSKHLREYYVIEDSNACIFRQGFPSFDEHPPLRIIIRRRGVTYNWEKIEIIERDNRKFKSTLAYIGYQWT